MCYSAQCWQAYRDYVREFGAIVDIHEFAQIYGYRKLTRKTKIPKGMDQNFIDPQSDLETQIKELIEEWNAEQLGSLEQELFKQVKRRNDAERALQLKTTKKSQEDLRISTNKIEQIKEKIADVKRVVPDPVKDNRIFPLGYTPILISENGKRVVRPMRYLLRPPGAPPSYDFDKNRNGTYNARRDNLTKFWRKQFGYTHGLMVVDTFYENVMGTDGQNQILQFKPRTGEPMLVPVLWAHWNGRPGEESLYSFAAITDDPEDEILAAGHDRCIINIKPEHIDGWLNPDPNNLDALFAIFDDKRHPYYEHRIAA
jgi:putative SOS response-associated peptidase YedK